jgi:DNA-nicking Smr family endonuclease
MNSHLAINTATATDDDEREYDRLRGRAYNPHFCRLSLSTDIRAVARASAAKRDSCLQRSKAAYKSGDGASARTLSNEGKKHKRDMERYNAAARDWIFRANNAAQPSDTIDLHRLFVEEAEEILAARINSSMASGEAGLHVIVGRGNHSANGVRKLAPAVQRLCTERGLKFTEEQNEGRIYVWLRPGTGGQGITPPGWGGHQQHDGPHQSHQQPPQLHQQQPHQQQPYQQQHQPDLLEETAENIFTRMAKCCIIM